MYKLLQPLAFWLVLTIISLPSKSQITNVLFIGNSYTGVNNLPQLVQEVALSAGDTFYVEAHTPGGTRFLSHAGNPEVYDHIRMKSWDYVILQGQSQEPSWPDGQVASDVFPYAKQLCDSIRAINPCTIPLFYMTWGRKNGDAFNCNSWPPVCTYAGMDSILFSNYQKMGVNNDAEVSPVGAVWNYLRTNTPGMELYSSDESHPSFYGSLAAAFTFYSAITRKSADSISYGYPIPDMDIDSIKSAVNNVFYLNQSTFNIGVNDPSAEGFTITKNGCDFSFSSEEGYDSYLWEFGDGKVATTKDANHVYSQSGEYWVKLTITSCGKTDIDSSMVSCGTGSINSLNSSKAVVYPNPTSGLVYITNGYVVEKVYNEIGQEIIFTDCLDNCISIELGSNHIIFIQMKNTRGVKSVRKLLTK